MAEMSEENVSYYDTKRQDAESKIPDWIERGSKFICHEKLEEWKKHVEVSARGIFLGLSLDEEIELMKRLQEDATFEEVTQTIINDETETYKRAVSAVLRFSDRGPDFTEYYAKAIGKYDDYSDIIEAQRKKNAELDNLQGDYSTKTVSAERKREEQEIVAFSAEKFQLAVEIENIEQRIKDLETELARLKDDLKDKQAQFKELS